MPKHLTQAAYSWAASVTPPPRVLLVEPDPATREALRWYCVIVLGIACAQAAAGPGALEAVRDWRPTVVLIDPSPTSPGNEGLLGELAEHHAELPIVAYTDPATAARLQQSSVVAAVVVKGQHALDRLSEAIRAAHPLPAPDQPDTTLPGQAADHARPGQGPDRSLHRRKERPR